jgi:uncharacterized membrane protein
MVSTSSSAGLARHVRRSVAWHRFREYVNGALWVLPTAAALVALAAGYVMSQVTHDPDSLIDRLAFQGTGDDARALLITVSSTVVTVIALVLGLTVVALQLSSTQFSPRLLRNFLRDRATQVVLSAFTATFVYSAAGLFTVGLAGGSRTEEFPRLAISGSILLLFISLGFVVYFADHLAHSIQIDAINRRIERNTRRTIVQEGSASVEEVPPRAPEWAVPLVGRSSGYIQTVHPELLLPLAAETDVTIGLRHRVGQHVIAGTVIGWVWTASAADPAPSAAVFEESVLPDISVGFERTIEQDIGFGIRQQTDIACKALSAAINDPYTAVQAVEHLAVVYCDLAVRPLGAKVLYGLGGRGRVVVPATRSRTTSGSSATCSAAMARTTSACCWPSSGCSGTASRCARPVRRGWRSSTRLRWSLSPTRNGRYPAPPTCSAFEWRSRRSVARSACGRGHRRRRVGGSVPAAP